MNRPRLIPAVLAAASAVVLLAAGCGDEDLVRSGIWVVSINENKPLESDVATAIIVADTLAGYSYKEDVVPIRFQMEGDVDESLVPLGRWGHFIIHSYEVEYDLAGQGSVEGFSAGLGIAVEVGQIIDGHVLLVPADRKPQPPLRDLLGSLNEIVATARVTFHAREVDSDGEVTFETAMPIAFADFGDEEED